MKQRIILIVSVVLGLFAALISGRYIHAKEVELYEARMRLERRYQRTEVVVLTRSLPAGTKLERDDLGSMAVPDTALRDEVVRVEKNVALNLLGRTLAMSVEQGKPLQWTDLEGGNPDQGSLAPILKKKMRAISINTSGSAAVSGMVRPSDHVDVIGTFSLASKDNPAESELVTMTILQDVLVLATGKETAKTVGMNPSNYSTVTLEVSPQEAEILIFAEQIRGRLSLSLRNPEDLFYIDHLPSVNFKEIRASLEDMNKTRQQEILKKRAL